MKNQKIIGWACFLLMSVLFMISVSYPKEHETKIDKVDTCKVDSIKKDTFQK